MRYALLIEYDGTDFHGSQLQKGVRTVQGELETAIATIYGDQIRISLAGRTDAGVHATGQVGAFDGPERHDAGTLTEALNYHLPDDVAVKSVEETRSNFDPRRDALERTYIYTLNESATRSPVGRQFEVRSKPPADLDAMRAACSIFEGSHDFASFAGPATPAEATTVRHITSVEVKRTSQSRVRVIVKGNAFLHQQVRRMVGALVRMATGKMEAGELRELLDSPRRGAAGWPLGPQGLCLAGIDYGKDGPFQAETEYN